MQLRTIISACLISSIAVTGAQAGTSGAKTDIKPDAKMVKPSAVKRKTRKLCPNGHVWDIVTKMCEEIDYDM